MPCCAEVRDSSNKVIWAGLRVRMGMAYGFINVKKPLMSGRCGGPLPGARFVSEVLSWVHPGAAAGVDSAQHVIAVGAVAGCPQGRSAKHHFVRQTHRQQVVSPAKDSAQPGACPPEVSRAVSVVSFTASGASAVARQLLPCSGCVAVPHRTRRQSYCQVAPPGRLLPCLGAPAETPTSDPWVHLSAISPRITPAVAVSGGTWRPTHDNTWPALTNRANTVCRAWRHIAVHVRRRTGEWTTHPLCWSHTGCLARHTDPHHETATLLAVHDRGAW